MGKNSHIEWTHHTFNPWWGCAKVSPACQHCYAETLTNRFGGAVWGVRGQRRFFGEQHWAEPTKWDAEAARTGKRFRVFCASMADVFEDRRDLDAQRTKLWDLIGRTQNLDWLLLTKRPEAVTALVPWGDTWPNNVWLGTSVENQEWADKRLPVFVTISAKVRFLSCEPLLGPLNLSKYAKRKAIHWIIAGGESGPKSRPMNPDWVRGLRDFAEERGIAFHFKQWGQWGVANGATINGNKRNIFTFENGATMLLRHKSLNGRHLDGRTYDDFPTSNSVPK